LKHPQLDSIEPYPAANYMCLVLFFFPLTLQLYPPNPVCNLTAIAFSLALFSRFCHLQFWLLILQAI